MNDWRTSDSFVWRLCVYIRNVFIGKQPRKSARNLKRLALLAPAFVIVVIDVVMRGSMIARFNFYTRGAPTLIDTFRGAHAPAYLSSVFVSAVVWASLLALACAPNSPDKRTAPRFIRTTAAAMFVFFFALSIGVEVAFRHAYGTYLSRDATELSTQRLRAALGSLRASPTNVLCIGVTLLLALLLLRLARRFVRVSGQTQKFIRRLTPFILVGLWFMPVSYRQYHASTPDLLWLNAVFVMVRGAPERTVAESSMQLRSPPRLAPLHATPARPRNVVLILQESVRADVVCIEYDPSCKLATTPTNDAVPKRIPFLEARANGSATAIAMAVLFTGLDPTTPQNRYLSAPTLWELAHAAGFDTAYLSSQHLMFANMWLWTMDVPSGNIVFATHLDPLADMFTGASDDKLAEYVKRFLPKLREPFFLVIHPSSIHTPRRGQNIEGPFVPASEAKHDRTAHFNGYKNAVLKSDRAIADMLSAIQTAPFGARTVVVYTSDHGEAFWEHGQGCEHGCSVFDEEIRVPTWIDAPPNTLSDDELTALHSAKTTPIFHVDLAATLLDLLGLWETSGVAPYRRFMLGQPLTRGGRLERIVPVTNVSHVWERGLPSYGLMRGTKKLAGMHRDGVFSCWDVHDDPNEKRDVLESCGDLFKNAQELYGRPPGQFDKLVFHPEWGPLVKE